MHSKRLAVVEVANNFLSCRAKEDIKEGSFLTDLWGRVSEKATRYTVQVGKNKHVDPEGMIRYMNHSCDSKTKFIYKNAKMSIQSWLMTRMSFGTWWLLVISREARTSRLTTM